MGVHVSGILAICAVPGGGAERTSAASDAVCAGASGEAIARDNQYDFYGCGVRVDSVAHKFVSVRLPHPSLYIDVYDSCDQWIMNQKGHDVVPQSVRL